MKTYSQAGQDCLVSELINNTDKHYFVDIGCWVPDFLNNTMLLEEAGWAGISLDITNLSQEWEVRNTPFINADALQTNYTELFEKYNLPSEIDYLNIDIEGNGTRFQVLANIMDTGYEFKVITIEHDSYRGYEKSEAQPQRLLLEGMGYVLLCKNVKLSGNAFEDWWINPKFFKEEQYNRLICENLEYIEILNKF